MVITITTTHAKRQKAYNKGYRQGYKRAIENSYRPHVPPYYRIYSPVYGPMVSPVPQRVIVAPAPWIIPVHPHNGTAPGSTSGLASICKQGSRNHVKANRQRSQ